MSHNLATKKDGKAAMMYVGEKPWHGLGMELDNPATSEEAIVAAGLDWKLRKVGLVGESDQAPVEGFIGLQRQDNQRIISVVGKRYEPIQNREAFSFMDSLVGGKQAVYHTAGALGFGERIWMMAKLPGSVKVNGIAGDEIEKFLLLVNSHDGTSSLRAFFTPIRVVCQNTLSMALEGAEGGVAIRHTKHAADKFGAARKLLGIATTFYADFEKLVEKMAGFKVSDKQTADFIKALVPDVEGETNTRRIGVREEITRLTVEGAGTDLPGVRGSLWGVYNGVTEYVDHVRGTRGSDDDIRAKNRLNSVWFGSGATLKRKALGLAEVLMA